MAYLRVSHRGKRTYYYIVRSFKDGDRVRQKVLEYLGGDPDPARLKVALAYWDVQRRRDRGQVSADAQDVRRGHARSIANYYRRRWAKETALHKADPKKYPSPGECPPADDMAAARDYLNQMKAVVAAAMRSRRPPTVGALRRRVNVKPGTGKGRRG